LRIRKKNVKLDTKEIQEGEKENGKEENNSKEKAE
jgi:hypothetical protein